MEYQIEQYVGHGWPKENERSITHEDAEQIENTIRTCAYIVVDKNIKIKIKCNNNKPKVQAKRK